MRRACISDDDLDDLICCFWGLGFLFLGIYLSSGFFSFFFSFSLPSFLFLLSLFLLSMSCSWTGFGGAGRCGFPGFVDLISLCFLLCISRLHRHGLRQYWGQVWNTPVSHWSGGGGPQRSWRNPNICNTVGWSMWRDSLSSCLISYGAPTVY
ncbi:hypothetical protein B0T26DRAFT_244496 [Lasiosphaeria miniovina]|uniref:Uncharacterized protein n=1 Tax=Lasiosphaeria miniovina TaxID=1954250 RepID=A0AA40E3S1_9PEZI|nr:uncharacterized protein B0T26DRAFT_244496 [Lasiosphaeria miniovina]KAK0722991.1 hypothetical protein B0T26DRAFT_244496 [Lasiosphaeria miniovina]